MRDRGSNATSFHYTTILQTHISFHLVRRVWEQIKDNFRRRPNKCISSAKAYDAFGSQTAEQNLRAQVIEAVQIIFFKKSDREEVFSCLLEGINRELKQLYTPDPLCCRKACYDELDSSLWNRCTLLEIFAWSSWHEPFCCKVLLFFCGRNKKSSVSKT